MSCSLAITQVAFTRKDKPDIQNNENLVDFGHAVPIFLLCLLLFAMVEMYFETHSGERHTKVSAHKTDDSQTTPRRIR